MTSADIEKILVWELENIADDLAITGDILLDLDGNEVEGATIQTLDIVLKRQFNRMQELLNEQL